MTTANNQATAYAYTTTLPTGDFRLIFWHQASTGIVSHSNFSQVFEISYGTGNYVQLYSNSGDATPELRVWRNEAGADAQVLASASYVSTWVRYLLTRTGTTWTLSYAPVGAGTWTSITSWTNANAWAALCFVASYIDLGNYTMPGALLRSCRLYTTAHSNADLLTDTLSATPTLSGLWAAWFDGSTVTLDGSDTSGNSRPITVVNTFAASTDDPISSGLAESAHTERRRLAPGGFSAALSATAHTQASRINPSGVLLTGGISAQAERLERRAGDSTPGFGIAGHAERTRLVARDATPTTAAALAAEFRGLRPTGFTAALATEIQIHTERPRLVGAGFSAALGLAAATERGRLRDGGISTALASTVGTEGQRSRAADFSTSGDAVLSAHTERLRSSSGGVTTAQAGTLATERAARRAANTQTDLGTAANTEPGRRQSSGANGALGLAAASERLAAASGGLTSQTSAAAATERRRLVDRDWATTGDAILFAHTERLRSSFGGLATNLGSSAATERQRSRAADFSASAGIAAASEFTEYLRRSAGGFAAALGASVASSAQRFDSGAVATATAAAAATERTRSRAADFSTNADAVLFAHTERLRSSSGGVTTAQAGTLATERRRLADVAAVAAANLAAASERMRQVARSWDSVQQAAQEAVLSVTRPGAASAALVHQIATERSRLRPQDYATGAVIFVGAHTESFRRIPAGATVTLGIAGHTARVRMADPGLTSVQTGPVLAAERLRATVRDWLTVVGTQSVSVAAERYRVAFGGFTAEVAVLPVTIQVGGAHGSGPFGSVPFGSQMFSLGAPQRLRVIAANALLVPHTGAVSNSNPRSSLSELNPKLWSIVGNEVAAKPRLPQRVLAVMAGVPVDGLPTPTQTGFVLIFDGPLSQGAQYRLAVTPPTVLIGSYTQEFRALYVRCDAIQRDERDDDGGIRDIANPWVSRDALQFPPALGTYQLTDDGDLANDTGEVSLRKRIIRRVSATAGDFFHLPGYGVGAVRRVKKTIRIGELERLQSRVKAQIAREPEVRQVSVQVRPVNGDKTVIAIAVTVTTVTQPKPTTVVVPVAL